MHSVDYLVDEARYKVETIDQVINTCHNHLENLHNNIHSVKNRIQSVFEHHIKTLQCRAEKLILEADDIYQADKKILEKQMNDLRYASNEIASSIQLCTKGIETSEEKRFWIKNAMNNYSDMTTSIISDEVEFNFQYNSSALDECILDFGHIMENRHDASECEFEIVPNKPNDGEKVCAGPKNIEMKVKSIEMYHMTSESALDEEKHDVSKTCDEDIKSDITSDNSLWLKKTRLQVETDLASASEISSETFSFSEWLHVINGDVKDVTCSENNVQNQPRCDENGQDLDHVNPNMQWLKAKQQVFDTHADTQWLIAKRRPTNENSTDDSMFVDKTDGDHCNTTVMTSKIDDSLTWIKSSVDSENSPVEEGWLVSALNSYSAAAASTSTNDASTDGSFLRQRSNVVHNKEPISHVIKHVNFILSQPLNAYLLKKESEEPVCDWLVGNSNKRCFDCKEECSFDIPTSNWLKTATDW